MSVLRLWRHSQCGLCSPLVRRGRAAEAAAAFFRWLYTGDFRTHLLEFGLIEREGEFARALKRYLARHEIPYYEADRFDRALFQPASDAESYLKRASDKRHRKDMARREKRLAAAGQMEYVRPSGAGEVDQWIRSFLDLEAAGWKGRNRTALACIAGGAAFLKRIVSEAFARNRLMMLGIRLNGRLIAAKCNLFAGTGSFAFKIAYDELYAEFSPGLLLEVENIRSLHGMREIEWMDSCAAPRHPMIDHLWPGRRAIETILVPGGKRFGGAIVTALPLLKRIKNGFRSAASVLDCRVLGRLRSHPAPGGGAANR